MVRTLKAFYIANGELNCPSCNKPQEQLTYVRLGEYECKDCGKFSKIECKACDSDFAHGVHTNCHHSL